MFEWDIFFLKCSFYFRTNLRSCSEKHLMSRFRNLGFSEHDFTILCNCWYIQNSIFHHMDGFPVRFPCYFWPVLKCYCMYLFFDIFGKNLEHWNLLFEKCVVCAGDSTAPSTTEALWWFSWQIKISWQSEPVSSNHKIFNKCLKIASVMYTGNNHLKDRNILSWIGCRIIYYVMYSICFFLI